MSSDGMGFEPGGAGPGARDGTGRTARGSRAGRAGRTAAEPAAPTARDDRTARAGRTGEARRHDVPRDVLRPARTGDGGCGGRRGWWRRSASFEDEIAHMRGPNGISLLGWLLMVISPAVEIADGRVAWPWLAGTGLGLLCALYAVTVLAAFREPWRDGPAPLRLLAALAATTFALALGYGGSFALLFVLVSLGVGSVARSRRALGLMLAPLSAAAGATAGLHHAGFWTTVGLAYGTFLSGLVVWVIITLFHAVATLRATRQELARAAVAQERLRFSRDLHDLLGHTLSVVVVKAEAARRLAARDLDAALGQVADIEAVGRQALTEIREAVTGYREGSLATELDRARSALAAADIEVVVRESGPPLPPQAEALLGWVVREGVTNVVRHSGASRTVIDLRTGGDRARLVISDNGVPEHGAAVPSSGSPDGGGRDDLGGPDGGFARDGSALRAGAADSTAGSEPAGDEPAGSEPAAPTASPAGPTLAERTAVAAPRPRTTAPAGMVRTGTGLRGLTERLAAAGGSLEYGRPEHGGGFRVTAVLPVEDTTAA